MTPGGSTFTARLGGTLPNSHDPWFRPIDLLTGPDGSVHVVDRHGKRAGDLDQRDNWVKTNGRIFKISYKNPEPVKAFDLSTWSSKDLSGLRTSGNDWRPDMAKRILAERADQTVVPKLKSLLDQDRDETPAMRDLWAFDICGGLDDETALRLLDHPVAGARRRVARLLGDRSDNPNDALRDRLVKPAGEDGDPPVRSQLAADSRRTRRPPPWLTASAERSSCPRTRCSR